ncbi:Tigger transposable element-derived protein 6-like [Oopsacas minuta]|uniref:Tigger transposable element-derived protein 6-like n=1 Tax=Oopsacas minuta TaxID=111878 RepID=A0AAV7KCA5_9METZ|nr:Tigger transposable element-derived protein 6-like [Oopsacas minuta]
MTSKIFVDWMKRTNQKFRFGNRNVLIFVDNCSSHPDVEASNLRLVFLPPNTTSKLRPMDAGIIQSVKINYRKRVIRHLISRMEACNTASELVKLVNILDAILWIKDVWSNLSITTIQKCFTKCGFQRQIEASESDILASPFEEIMRETEFILDGITLSQFATFDNNLATFATSRDDWETEIVEKAKGVDLNDSERYSDENEDSNEDQKERSDKVISMTEAGVMIGKLKKFLFLIMKKVSLK